MSEDLRFTDESTGGIPITDVSAPFWISDMTEEGAALAPTHLGVPVTLESGLHALLAIPPKVASRLQIGLEKALEPQDGEGGEEEFDGDMDSVSARSYLAVGASRPGEAGTHLLLGGIGYGLLAAVEALKAPERYKARMSVTAYGNNVDELETYARELVEPYFPGRTTRIAECNMRIVGSVEQKERGCAVAANVVVEVVD